MDLKEEFGIKISDKDINQLYNSQKGNCNIGKYPYKATPNSITNYISKRIN